MWPRGSGNGEWGPARRGRPRFRDASRDDVPDRGVGIARTRQHPCLGVGKIPGIRIARSLDVQELARLRRALHACEARSPVAVAPIRLPALRRPLPEQCAQSAPARHRGRCRQHFDAKTGPGAVPLGGATRAHIRAPPRALAAPARSCSRAPPKPGAGSALQTARARFATPRSPTALASTQDPRRTPAGQGEMSGENLPPGGRRPGHRRQSLDADQRTCAGVPHSKTHPPRSRRSGPEA